MPSSADWPEILEPFTRCLQDFLGSPCQSGIWGVNRHDSSLWQVEWYDMADVKALQCSAGHHVGHLHLTQSLKSGKCLRMYLLDHFYLRTGAASLLSSSLERDTGRVCTAGLFTVGFLRFCGGQIVHKSLYHYTFFLLPCIAPWAFCFFSPVLQCLVNVETSLFEPLSSCIVNELCLSASMRTRQLKVLEQEHMRTEQICWAVCWSMTGSCRSGWTDFFRASLNHVLETLRNDSTQSTHLGILLHSFLSALCHVFSDVLSRPNHWIFLAIRMFRNLMRQSAFAAGYSFLRNA